MGNKSSNKFNAMRNIVWAELVHVKFWEQYLSQYSDYENKINRISNIILLSMSTIGAALPGLYKLVPESSVSIMDINICVFAIMIIVQIISLVVKNIISDDSTITEVINLRVKYLDYLNDVEQLWIDIWSDSISGEEAEKRYYDLRKKDQPVEILKDSIGIKMRKGPYRRGCHQAYVRLNNKYKSNIPEELKYERYWITRVLHWFSEFMHSFSISS